MTKHTPGPWEITAEHIITGNTEYIAWLEETTVEEKEMKANAQLIAAAPELLELLKEIEGTLDWVLDTVESSGVYEELQKVRAAIAKATGES